ncbi:L,D-transpeptidase [Streptomyces melanogenes]|uniref:L,D-transpeptidase n=1 Tax=Streptomyces melanogenes TaxID=67326 RepID=UPI00167CD5AC|nr:Ig-like domain-containing protein [Streptomyces melanogenes]
MKRRAGARAAAAAVLLALLSASAGCGSASGPGPGGDAKAAARATGITAAAGNRHVTVRTGVGRLASVRVSAPGPGDLAGSLSADRRMWVSRARPAPGVTYTVVVRAMGEDGERFGRTAAVNTPDPPEERTVVGVYSPDGGTTVGVAMPVSIVFNRPVRDKATVERHLSVTSVPPTEGSWSWLKDRDGSDRADWRPKEYWKPDTRVTLRMGLDGVDTGGGFYGIQNRVVNFRIGAAVISTVDVAKRTMTVSEGGRRVRTLPVSAGKEGFDTWNGTLVVLDKSPALRMDSASVGIFGPDAYDLGRVEWNVRLTASGTYLHAAPWNEDKFGKANGSHGCVGMGMADARWFYERAHPGDPVTVVHSKQTVAVNNGYGDWNVDWVTWRAGSALR